MSGSEVAGHNLRLVESVETETINSATLSMPRQTDLTTLPAFRYHALTMKRDEPSLMDLTPYAGRWVALVRGRVAGVGWTADEARLAAKRSRPKEKSRVIFVPAVEVSDDDGSST